MDLIEHDEHAHEAATEFDRFYDTKVLSALEALKPQSEKLNNWTVAILAAIAALLILILMTNGKGGGGIITVLLIGLVVFFAAKYYITKNRFIDSYKNSIIKEVVRTIDPDIIYKPDHYISHKEYNASKLFTMLYDIYDGDDLVKGVYKGIPFRCSELNVSLNQRKGSYVTLFKGLFICADIAKGRGATYIWNSEDDQIPESMGDKIFRRMALPKIIKVKLDPVFNKYYTVYSTDPGEARMILSTARMKRILHIRKRLARPVVFSFVMGRCYVAIPFEEDLLEPSFNNPGNKEEIKEYFMTIMLALSLVKEVKDI